MGKEKPWNRCDVCGRFIAYEDFTLSPSHSPAARRVLVAPDSDYSYETWETLCKEHSGPNSRLKREEASDG